MINMFYLLKLLYFSKTLRSDLLTGVGCKAIWDNIACWDRAEVGETVTRECPRVLKMFFGRNGKVLYFLLLISMAK